MSLAGGYWEGYYRRGNVPWDPGPYDRNLPEVLNQHAVRRGTALDVGCGTGGTLVYLATRGFLHMFTFREEQQAVLRRIRQLLEPDGLFYGLFAKREGARSFGGPPKWSAAEIEEAVLPHFSSVELTPGVFTPGEPGSMPAWILVARRR